MLHWRGRSLRQPDRALVAPRLWFATVAPRATVRRRAVAKLDARLTLPRPSEPRPGRKNKLCVNVEIVADPFHHILMSGAASPDRFPRAVENAPHLRSQRAPVDCCAQLAIAALFQATSRAMSNVQPTVPAEAKLAPSTVIVFTHKRDLDIPVLIATLLGPRVWRRWLGRVTFVGSADLFIDGFLGYYYPQLGRPLRALLSHSSIRPV